MTPGEDSWKHRAPDFWEKASRVLELCHGRWWDAPVSASLTRGRDQWALFYKASVNWYERNVLVHQFWEEALEDCFDCAAFAHLRSGL